MKLLELEIKNVRGIRHLFLKLDGKNLVIWGPNGAGKSAVVDALDFLLTGRISRLTGRGTSGISLAKHGPHIDQEPKDAVVRARVLLPGLKEPVEIARCMAQSEVLECEDNVKAQLEPITSLARRGQHVLTRRDILRYITAEASARAQGIQELLNISEVENIRASLVKANNELKRELKSAKERVEVSKAEVNTTINEKRFRPEKVLQAINQCRAVLGGQPISSPLSTELKIGLAHNGFAQRERSVNLTLFKNDITKISALITDQLAVGEVDQQLRILVTAVRSDPELMRSISHRGLTELGIKLLDETGNCPLCSAPWPPGKLLERLKTRLSTAKLAEQHQSKISKLSAQLRASVTATIANVQSLNNVARLAKLSELEAALQSWLANLNEFLTTLTSPVEKYLNCPFSSSEVARLLSPEGITKIISEVEVVISANYPEASEEQTAWDTLTRLEVNLSSLENSEDFYKRADLSYRRASILSECFEKARDAVLGKLYEEIKDRFVELYRKLHGVDEDRFMADIAPEGAGLNFEVDFHGRGKHPPHALHSEGHQDSMGLCLYLALAERLAEGLIELIILDDVVMSVDSDHRRELCRLLATSFPDKQFLITTHDKTWANQLRSEGVVRSNGYKEFFFWHIETGPKVNDAVDMWDRIAEDLRSNDVTGAAVKLRRGSEEVFASVCDALAAPVKFKLNGKWELGDLLPAAMNRYKNLLKKAKNAAQSWGDKDTLAELEELESMAGQIFARCQAEQWAVNSSIHYENWFNLSKEDFKPVVEAFQDLYNLFVCSSTDCRGMLKLTTSNMEEGNLRCRCGKVNWNLMVKQKIH